MKTFHVGSLPFLNIEQALNFTFKFDIPTLFTLPKLNAGQLIGADLINLLKLGTVNGYENIKLHDPSFNEKKDLFPYYYDDFFRKMDQKKITQFKYQVIGPISFYSILKRSNRVEFKDIYRFLLETYTELYQKLSNHGDVILVLDEPMLGSDFLSFHQALNNFATDLSKIYPEVLIHCCAKLSLQEISQINVGLNLDLNLYKDDELRQLKLVAPGLSRLENKNYNILVIKNIIKQAKYFTPSCGLAYKSIQEINTILDYMNELKSL